MENIMNVNHVEEARLEKKNKFLVVVSVILGFSCLLVLCAVEAGFEQWYIVITANKLFVSSVVGVAAYIGLWVHFYAKELGREIQREKHNRAVVENCMLSVLACHEDRVLSLGSQVESIASSVDAVKDLELPEGSSIAAVNDIYNRALAIYQEMSEMNIDVSLDLKSIRDFDKKSDELYKDFLECFKTLE